MSLQVLGAALAASSTTNAPAAGAGTISNVEIFDRLSGLYFINSGPKAKQLYNLWNGGRLAYGLYQRLSGADAMNAVKQEFFASIVSFVQAHPNSTDEEKAAEIQKQVFILSAKIQAILNEGTLPATPIAAAPIAAATPIAKPKPTAQSVPTKNSSTVKPTPPPQQQQVKAKLLSKPTVKPAAPRSSNIPLTLAEVRQRTKDAKAAEEAAVEAAKVAEAKAEEAKAAEARAIAAKAAETRLAEERIAEAKAAEAKSADMFVVEARVAEASRVLEAGRAVPPEQEEEEQEVITSAAPKISKKKASKLTLIVNTNDVVDSSSSVDTPVSAGGTKIIKKKKKVARTESDPEQTEQLIKPRTGSFSGDEGVATKSAKKRSSSISESPSSYSDDDATLPPIVPTTRIRASTGSASSLLDKKSSSRLQSTASASSLSYPSLPSPSRGTRRKGRTASMDVASPSSSITELDSVLTSTN